MSLAGSLDSQTAPELDAALNIFASEQEMDDYLAATQKSVAQ
ncbi:hypothetical protein [Marinobacter sp. R17]|nr:hypothetical protein [Marinobacter sp. R17]